MVGGLVCFFAWFGFGFNFLADYFRQCLDFFCLGGSFSFWGLVGCGLVLMMRCFLFGWFFSFLFWSVFGILFCSYLVGSFRSVKRTFKVIINGF